MTGNDMDQLEALLRSYQNFDHESKLQGKGREGNPWAIVCGWRGPKGDGKWIGAVM